MTEKSFETPCGSIRYWVGGAPAESKLPLAFLPGLTADHRLFERQVAHFAERRRVFVWDAPGHAKSWPFSLTFSLTDKARWLDEILLSEGMAHPVIVGQSMGGYVAQAYAGLFPDRLKGFVSIDSAPLQRKYMTKAELWLLRRTEPMYRRIPWRLLVQAGANGTAVSEYGRTLMRDMMAVYDGNQKRYAQLAGHGFRIVAEAVEASVPCEISCPALLICGAKDRAGSTVRYNKAWHRNAGIPLEWIPGAGHNANTDAPDAVNVLIERLLSAAEA
ncbi:MAG: alpha/beta hydrolase [Treponemataceae bacterium]|nr:alpha/beta hydrolase [Treponemataceae bacterium]